MPTDKRVRKREGREARLAELRALEARAKRKRRMIALGVVAVAVVGVAFVFSGGGDDEVATTNSTTTTIAGESGSGDVCPPADGTAVRTTKFDKAPTMCIDPAKTYTAKIVTDAGFFDVKLDAAKAPKTVNNFVFLARYHYFDGLTYHRVIPDFVLQGGDPKGDGTGGPGYEFEDELPASVDEYKEGSLAMANSGKNTNGSQFFVVVSDAGGRQLSVPNYSLFGQVTEGIDVVKKIEADGSPDGKPKTVHKMITVTITES